LLAGCDPHAGKSSSGHNHITHGHRRALRDGSGQRSRKAGTRRPQVALDGITHLLELLRAPERVFCPAVRFHGFDPLALQVIGVCLPVPHLPPAEPGQGKSSKGGIGAHG
jgi:hypothetical protein